VIELFSNLTVEQWFFYPFAALALLGAAGVVVARNPLHGAISLVVSFFFLAALFILLAAHLVGVLQVIVYAGAIMVLFLFVIMLLSLGEAELGRPRPTVLKVVGAAFAVGVVAAGYRVFQVEVAPRVLPEQFGTAAAVGQALFNDYLLPFEAVSLLLLVAIAGAVVVAKGKL
jgi:NADH-quinone oxidoreductase subunit J